MTLSDLAGAARGRGLALRGAFHPKAADRAPEGTGTIVMIGPDEPRFWPIFTAAPEYRDGAPDPLDRWSRRVIDALAQEVGATALYPSDGPPYAPFIRWAERTGTAWPSPVGPLVQAEAGLFISYRAALALPARLPLSDTPTQPCPRCARPCETACPVGALSPDHPYDVPRCKAHIASDAGEACRAGCLVRRACPVAVDFARLPEQSAFHQSAFMRNWRP
ncbi:hypothetical protein JYP51_13425 [Ponticoccus gilvus]|nr:hypothetical protein [Enemella evansiae]